MNKDIREKMRRLNIILKENEALYDILAKKSGLSSCAFWIMYSIREANEAATICTQKEICEQWVISKRTVHSALKGLEKDGYLALSSSENDKRSKEISLTAKGLEFARKNIDIVFELEQNIYQKMGDTGFQTLIESHRRYNELLQLEVDHFLK